MAHALKNSSPLRMPGDVRRDRVGESVNVPLADQFRLPGNLRQQVFGARESFL